VWVGLGKTLSAASRQGAAAVAAVYGLEEPAP
jgi:hypothetical protein